MIDINKLIDKKTLQQIQDKFSDATGLAAIAVDMNGNYITEGSNFTEFCMKYTRGSAEGLRRCVKCDNECTGTYYCHAGLMDFSCDLVINGEKVGAIIGGQVLPNEPDEAYFRKIARELGINEDEYIKALHKVPIKNEKSIQASAGLLADVVNLLINLKYIENMNKKKVDVFNSELSSVTSNISSIKTNTSELEDIASMENILSINAMIEASRAGRAGNSFAIVAREMSELSKKSTGAYSKIKDCAEQVTKSVNRMNNVEL
ncbi:putative methyl-accepting chemotaxis protein [Oscillibacter valericigenes Sjm18-20]|nr:putative methyl-accepting chemotaxis protein [Oscillibacter valericigenes Sjm18-20]